MATKKAAVKKAVVKKGPVKKAAVSKIDVGVVKKEAPKNNGSASKSNQVAEYMKSHPGMSRKDLLEVFVNQIGLTPKGSATYYFTLKKKLNYK
jgi:hypothetical protein